MSVFSSMGTEYPHPRFPCPPLCRSWGWHQTGIINHNKQHHSITCDLRCFQPQQTNVLYYYSKIPFGLHACFLVQTANSLCTFLARSSLQCPRPNLHGTLRDIIPVSLNGLWPEFWGYSYASLLWRSRFALGIRALLQPWSRNNRSINTA